VSLEFNLPQFSFHPLTMKNSTILKVEHLSKYFKSGQQTLTVLNDVSFEIEQGSACAIVGT